MVFLFEKSKRKAGLNLCHNWAMVLDNLDSRELGIDTLSIEPGKLEAPPFDPKKDITPKQWDEFTRDLEVRRQISASVAVLDPKSLEGINLDHSIERYEAAKSSAFAHGDWLKAAEYLAVLKRFCPEGLRYGSFDEDLREIINHQDDEKANDGMWGPRYFACLKEISPETFQDPSQRLLSNAKWWLENISRREAGWKEFAETAAATRIVFGDKFDRKKNVGVKEWEGMKKEYEEERKKGGDVSAIKLAESMAILAAKEGIK